MVMRVDQEKIWAGTEASLHAAIEAESGITSRLQAGNYTQPTDEEERSRLLEVSDGVAVVAIHGPLNNDADGFWNEMFGMTGYPEIRDALVQAANDPEVKQILLDIDSGGGAVSGLSDTANLVSMINDKVKPVSTFTDGTMASAAYWLGCSAGSVQAGRTAVVGSIGVITTHTERSAALKEAGIGVTVIRSGQYKGLVNSVEKLTEEGKAQIQQVVDAASAVFTEHVASRRGKTAAYTDSTMGQGREFVGQAGVDVGLLDAITTFDDVMSALKEKAIDSSNNFMDNRGKPKGHLTGSSGTDLSGEHDMKQALTTQDIAALAAGATALNAGAVTDPAAAVADPAITDPVAVADPVVVVDPVADPAATSAVVENVDTSAVTIQLLTAQVAAKDEALLQAGIKASKLEEQVATLSASVDPLREIACAAINNIQVALGGSATDLQGMNSVQVVAEHARLAVQFAEKFKAGGIAAVSANQAVKQEPQINPRHKALVNAVRFQSK